MVYLSSFVTPIILVCSALSFPLTKRISEITEDSMSKWKPACIAANGGQTCFDLSVKNFETLLAAAKPCDQQNAADGMVDLAKKLNSQEMIRLTQIFVQQPRITVRHTSSSGTT